MPLAPVLTAVAWGILSFVCVLNAMALSLINFHER